MLRGLSHCGSDVANLADEAALLVTLEGRIYDHASQQSAVV
jgi:hypothetical protein